jgi:hypothetical protein
MAGLDWGPTGQPRNGVVLLKAARSLRKLHRVVADFLAVVLEILGAALVETELVDDGAVEAIRTAAERFEEEAVCDLGLFVGTFFQKLHLLKRCIGLLAEQAEASAACGNLTADRYHEHIDADLLVLETHSARVVRHVALGIDGLVDEALAIAQFVEFFGVVVGILVGSGVPWRS